MTFICLHLSWKVNTGVQTCIITSTRGRSGSKRTSSCLRFRLVIGPSRFLLNYYTGIIYSSFNESILSVISMRHFMHFYGSLLFNSHFIGFLSHLVVLKIFVTYLIIPSKDTIIFLKVISLSIDFWLKHIMSLFEYKSSTCYYYRTI